MDPAKITAVTEWPAPTTLNQLQCVLGFAHFYWCFIRNYSHLAAPLTTLTFTSSPFHLSPEAESASQELKCFFTSVPVLTLVDPDFQFVVEVDSSDTRVGANNLATISCRPKASHMCFLFSQAIPSRKELQYGQPGTSSS